MINQYFRAPIPLFAILEGHDTKEKEASRAPRSKVTSDL